MSSIFVEDNDMVDVVVCYKIEDGILVILDGDQPEAGQQSLTVKFTRPNWAISQKLLQSSTYTGPNGEPEINLMQMQSNLLYALAKSWDAKDKDNKPIELNNASISKLRVEIAKTLISKLIGKMGAIF